MPLGATRFGFSGSKPPLEVNFLVIGAGGGSGNTGTNGSSGVVSINLANGNTGTITLTENITDIDFTNVPTNGISTFTLQITQDSTDRTVAINAVTVNGGGDVTGLTPGAAGLTLSTGAADIDLVSFLFFDAGTPLINSLLDFS